MDVEESHCCSRLGGSGERDAEEQGPRDIHRRNREVQERKRVQRTRRRSHQELWAASHVRQNPGRILRTQEHVAGCKHPTSPKRGTTCSSGRMRRYIMNRKRKEKSSLRKEGDVYVLVLFVKVPSGAAAPNTSTSSWKFT